MTRLASRWIACCGVLVFMAGLVGCQDGAWSLGKQKEDQAAAPEEPLEELVPEEPKPAPQPDSPSVRIYSSAELAAQRQEVEPKDRYAPAAPPSEHVHTLQRGETLFSLARKYYGDQRQWRRIYQANRTRILDPQKLPVGMKLIIP
jgi:nucleoid-associated protein YgaU